MGIIINNFLQYYVSVPAVVARGFANGLSSGQRHAIIWTNAGILLIGPLGTDFNEVLIEIHKFVFKNVHLKISSGKWRPSCLGLNALIDNKRKPPCIGGMELVSLSCNRVFISAESVGRGWCKIAIATKWYQFHTTDKCGFLFMPWITDQLYICAIHKTSK